MKGTNIQYFLDSLLHESVILDENLKIKFLNNVWEGYIKKNLNLSTNQIIGSNYVHFLKKVNNFSRNYSKNLENGIKAVINKKKNKFEKEYSNSNSKNEKWFRMIVTPFKKGVLITHEDITKGKIAQQNLKIKEKQYRKIFDESPIGIVIEDDKGNILKVNETICEMTGYQKSELEGNNIFDTLVPQKRIERAKENIKTILKGKDLEFNIDNKTKQGKTRHTHFKETKIDLPDQGLGILSMRVDLSKLKQKEKELKYLSYHDQLTGVYNRYYFDKKLKNLDVSEKLPLSIIIADVNGLKLVNDTYGHAVGDKLIKKTANLLKNNLRKKDILARFGGDEFSILLPKTSEEDAKKILRKIKSKSNQITIKDFNLSLGLGMATKKDNKEKIHKIFNKADNNMYKDKLTKGKSAKSKLVKSLINTLGVKSNETKEHAIRVEKLAIKLGQKLNLNYEQLNNLSLLATLHDIGKVTISEEILKKPGRLNNTEWEIMKEHAQRGYNIASSTDGFSLVAKYILHHHERWDGSGYPAGLKKEEIPLLSRIISLVDAFDVMTNDRPYSQAISKNDAILEIKKCSGSQFDPKIAENFISLF